MKYNVERTAEKLEELLYSLNKLYSMKYGRIKFPEQQYGGIALELTKKLMFLRSPITIKLYKKVTITLRPTEFIVVGFKVPVPKDRWEEIKKFINNEIEKLLEGVAFLYGYFERRKNNNNPETPRIYLEVDSIEEEIDIYFSPDFANLFVEEIDISGGIEYMILDLEDKMKPKYGFYENNSAAWLHRIVKSISRIKNVTDVKEIVNLLCHFASDELYVPNSDLFQITPTEKLERFCEGILMDIWL